MDGDNGVKSSAEEGRFEPEVEVRVGVGGAAW